MSAHLRIPPEVRAAITDHALTGAPQEVCGVLLGPDPDTVAAVWRAENVDEEPVRHYTIDPKAIIEAMDWAGERDMEVVGFYHSHPRGPDHPSETDEARATWIGAVYLIRCLEPDMLGAWRWDGDDFQRVQLK